MSSQIIGNTLLAASIAFAGYAFLQEKEYKINYNTFKSLTEYTVVTKGRSLLANESRLEKYFDGGAEIPSDLIITIKEDDSEHGIKVRQALTDLVNYYEAICMGRVTGALSKEVIDQELLPAIQHDQAILKHWFPQSAKKLKASYPYLARCSE